MACPIILITFFIAIFTAVSAERSGMNIVREEYPLIIGAARLYSGEYLFLVRLSGCGNLREGIDILAELNADQSN